MKFYILILFVLISTSLGDIWTNCGPNEKFKITSVSIVPDPPVKGKLITISGSGVLGENVTSGEVAILVKFGLITLINEKKDICTFPGSPLTCPIKSGEYTHSVNFTIPEAAPNGKYTGHVSVTDQDSSEIALEGSQFTDIWNSCGKPNDTFQISNVTISPDPPVKGQKVSIFAEGLLKDVISSGDVVIQIKYNFITIIKETKPICSSDDPFSCPIQPGQYSHSIDVDIPSNVPKGKYSGHFVLIDQSSDEIACIDVSLEF
ncbi:hypothetical protein ACTFIU_006952 [Dictyostelium citrinum]